MYRGRFRSRLHSLRVETCGRCGQGRADRRFQRGASHGQTRAVLCEVTGGGFRPDAPPVHAGAVPERPANRDAAEPRPRHVALPARRHRVSHGPSPRRALSSWKKISALQATTKSQTVWCRRVSPVSCVCSPPSTPPLSYGVGGGSLFVRGPFVPRDVFRRRRLRRPARHVTPRGAALAGGDSDHTRRCTFSPDDTRTVSHASFTAKSIASSSPRCSSVAFSSE